MNLDALKGLPMRSIAAYDCALFLWATFPTLSDVFPLLDAWGFKYKTVAFTWVKVSKNNKLKMGMGNWTRANAEICLLATRGHPKRVSASVQSAILAEPREHSQKPDEVRERIVQLMGDVPRIELFARTHTPGWDVWGLETGKFDEEA